MTKSDSWDELAPEFVAWILINDEESEPDIEFCGLSKSKAREVEKLIQDYREFRQTWARLG